MKMRMKDKYFELMEKDPRDVMIDEIVEMIVGMHSIDNKMVEEKKKDDSYKRSMKFI